MTVTEESVADMTDDDTDYGEQFATDDGETHLFDLSISYVTVTRQDTGEERVQCKVEGPDGQTAIADDPMVALMHVVSPLVN